MQKNIDIKNDDSTTPILHKRKQSKQIKHKMFSFKIVWYYFKYYKWTLLLQFILATVASAIAIGVNIALQYALSASSVDFKYISIMCGALIGLYIFNWFIQYSQYVLSIRMGQRISKQIRDDIFKKLNNLSISYYDKNKSGDIISKFSNDITNLSSLLSDNFADILGVILWIFGLLIGMFIISPILSAITIVLVSVVVVSLFFCIKKSHPFFNKTQTSIANITAFLDETISGQSVIDIFNQKDFMIKQFEKLNAELTNNIYYSQSYSSSSIPITTFFSNAITLIITLIGMGFMWANSDVFIGLRISLPYPSPMGSSFIALTIFLLLARNFLSPFSQVASIMPILLAAKAGVERLIPIINEKTEFNDLEKSIVNIAYQLNKSNMKIEEKNNIHLEPSLEFENVSFSYVKDKPILKNVSFKIKPGQFVGIVGPTGSGKTTIINLITKFYEINSGDIKIGGMSIKDISRKSLRDNIAMVVQDTYIFNISIKENIKIANPNASDEEVMAAAKIAMCHELIMNLPDGYDTIMTNNAEVLSKGEKQLISMARAVLSDSDFLILDEATSSIDTKTEKIIQAAFENIMKYKTCILIAHRLSTIRNANIIIVLKDGEIIESGNHDELMDYNGFYSKLINSQFGNLIE